MRSNFHRRGHTKSSFETSLKAPSQSLLIWSLSLVVFASSFTEESSLMGRAPCCDKANVKRGPWSPEEDTVLKNYVERYGTGGNWIALPHKAGLKRCGKSCRLRWLNYLRPDIKHGGFTEEEDNIICSLYKNLGSRWSVIASNLPGRTDNDVKNYWNTKLKKKLIAANSNPTSNTNTTSNKPTYTSSSPSVVPIVKTENYCYSFSPNLAQNSIQIPPLDAGFAYNVEPNRLFADPTSIPQMDFKEMSEFSACTPNYSVSSSQEVSGPLSSLPMDSNYISWSNSEIDGLLMELSSGPAYDPFNSRGFSENTGEIAPNLANLFYANNMLGTTETKQQGLYQGVLS